jgi:hypothetical protein
MPSDGVSLDWSDGKPQPTDLAFLVFLVLVVAAVALIGTLTFSEGLKTETSKAQGEAFLAWVSQARSQRASAQFAPSACAQMPPSERVGSSLWRDCAGALTEMGGPLAGVRNAFSGEPIRFIARCDPSDRKSPGQLVIERISANPPGSAVPQWIAPVAPDAAMDQPLTLRVTVCDKGGYGVKIGEAEF